VIRVFSPTPHPSPPLLPFSSTSDFVAAHLPTFRAANPQLAVETLIKPGKHPTLDGAYLNGTRRSVPVRNTPAAGVAAAAAELRDAAGRKASVSVPGRRHVPALRSKHVHGEAAGVQGGWTATTPTQQ
jgi:hypothetical protein